MKKKFIAAAVTVFLCLSFVFSASALSADEALVRKRVYYPGINNTVLLLSNNLGDLSNVQIKRILVTSPKIFTSEEDVKDYTISEARKNFSLSSISVTIRFSAFNGRSTQDYIFNRYLSLGSSYTLSPLSDSDASVVFNYNSSVSCLSSPSMCIAPGIAYQNLIIYDQYYHDIDLVDYQNLGYSLSVPLQQSSDSSLVSLFPLMRKRAYYPTINHELSLLSSSLGSLKDVQVKRIIIKSLKDFTSCEAVEANIAEETSADTASYTILVDIQFSASDSSGVHDYLFYHYPAAGASCLLLPLTSVTTIAEALASDENLVLYNYNSYLSTLSNYGDVLAPGIAYTNLTGDNYYIDIDLTDYQTSGYSLAVAA